MQNILVPIGISKNAKSNLKFAIKLANSFGSSIYAIDTYLSTSSLTSISNVSLRLAKEKIERIRILINQVKPKASNIKIVESELDLIGAIKKLDQNIGIDLIITASLNNEINNEVFLGPIAGSLIKRLDIPVLVAPLNKGFKPPKKMLLAFKTGEVKDVSTLNAMIEFQDKFKAKLKLLLVKVPGFINRNHSLDDILMKRSENLIYSENETVYKGVLEYFQVFKPDILVTFKRERGFFEKLWESDIIYKKDFYCKVPLLVLKNKD